MGINNLRRILLRGLFDAVAKGTLHQISVSSPFSLVYCFF